MTNSWVEIAITMLPEIISIIALILVPIVVIAGIFMYKRTKNKFILPCVTVALIFLLLLILWSLSWWFTFKAYTSVSTDNLDKEAEYHTLAAKVAIFPSTRAVMYSNLASYQFLSLHDGPSAIKSYEKACKYTKNCGKMPLGIIYSIKGDYKKAIDIYSKQQNYHGIATDYILMKDYPKALIAINKAINNAKNERTLTESIRTRAIIYKRMKNDKLAQKDFKTLLDTYNKQIKRNPDMPWLYQRRAIIYNDMQKENLAKKDYEKAVSLSPQNDFIKSGYKEQTTSVEDYFAAQKKYYNF
jgi:tetratricopeptide (TPR) repeat protein